MYLSILFSILDISNINRNDRETVQHRIQKSRFMFSNYMTL